MVAWMLSLALTAPAAGGRQATAVPQAAPPEINILVKEVLEDLLQRGAMPDGNLLVNSRRIAVRSDLPRAAMRLDNEALPERPGLSFYFLSRSDAQSEANRSKQRVHLITVDSPEFAQNSATLSVGIELVVPSEPKVVVMCCCTGHGEFSRVDGRWRFTKWLGMICS